MIKKFLYALWTFSLQKGWNWIWSKTTVDEKAIAVAKEVKRRAEIAAEELEDVKDSLKDAIEESKDIASAVKGETKKRKKHGS
jgi:hypothetical protein